jgi:hypothetical protein
MAFECDVQSTSFVYPVSFLLSCKYILFFQSLTPSVTKTCLTECFHNGGSCAWDGPAPYCVCGFFYSGENCTELWTGVYTLIAVFIIAFIVLVSVVGCSIYKKTRPDATKKRRVPLGRFQEYEKEGLIVNK